MLYPRLQASEPLHFRAQLPLCQPLRHREVPGQQPLNEGHLRVWSTVTVLCRDATDPVFCVHVCVPLLAYVCDV